MFGIGPQEILLILIFVLVLFFGAKRIPEIARGLGRSLSEFKKGVREVDADVKDALDTKPPKKDRAEPDGKSPAGG